MTTRNFFPLIVCLAALVTLCAAAQDSSTDSAVTEFVKAEMQRQHIPGLSLLVARNGNIVLAEGFGLSNVELQVPVKPESVFQSGSVGKQFTATAVMTLVEEGKIALDDPLTKYFPDAPSSWQQVTVRNLLSHTAGFGDYPKDFNFRKDWTEDELLKVIESIPWLIPPVRNGSTAISGTRLWASSSIMSRGSSTETFFRPASSSPWGCVRLESSVKPTLFPTAPPDIA